MSKNKRTKHASAAALRSESKGETSPVSDLRAPRSLTTFPESAEPTAAKGTTPVLLLTLLGLILYGGDMYVMQNGGDVMAKTGAFPAQVYYPFKSYAEVDKMHPKTGEGAVLEQGRFVYFQKAKCDACHMLNGQGSPGLNPPLAGSEWVLAEGPNRIIRIVLHGLQGPIEVKGQSFNAAMLAWRDILTDEDIANVLSFIRNEWGNKAPLVTPEQVKAIREETAARDSNWTPTELLAVPEK